ncbi:hypothetical protein ACFXKR_41475 [Streptomyces violascens]|uniref:hypothetical protein n=1 Tax=Streptomyces violascens TaxID=67381 RepID=UPI00368E4A07
MGCVHGSPPLLGGLDELIATLALPLGVAGRKGSTVIVGLNGLHLIREAAWSRPAKDMT